MEHCTEGALSMEVWGHRSTGFGGNLSGWEMDQVMVKSRSIMDRYVVDLNLLMGITYLIKLLFRINSKKILKSAISYHMKYQNVSVDL